LTCPIRTHGGKMIEIGLTSEFRGGLNFLKAWL
jgi:hypothetical protein